MTTRTSVKKTSAKRKKTAARASAKKSGATGAKPKGKAAARWSGEVTEHSNAMDIEDGTFKQRDPAAIARELERDAERSTRRKSTPYRSAMSMLTFYINRAGKNLTAKQRRVLEEAKTVLRDEFGPQSPTKKSPTKARRKKAAS